MSEYVPVTKFMTEDGDPRLQWAFAFPPSVDAERIEIRTGQLFGMQRWGGLLSSLVVDYQGERDEYTAGISGVNADGTAIASKVTTYQKAEETKSHHIHNVYDGNRLPFNYDKVESVNQLNKPALADKVIEKTRAGVAPEVAWAKTLDGPLRKSIREVSKANLVGHTGGPVKRTVLALLLADIYEGVATGDHFSDAILGVMYAISLGSASTYNKQVFGNPLIRARRWSLSPLLAYQPDRQLVVAGLSKVPGLLRARK